MRMSRTRRAAARDARADEMDMTPMIDVTFQLIVFFLVANDLSRKEIVDLSLPAALNAAEDGRCDTRMILNLRRPRDPEHPPATPEVTVRGRPLELRSLSRELASHADLVREEGPGSPSGATVLIRADRDVPWRHVQFVMQACAAPAVRIHRVQFATTRPAEGPVAAK